MQQKPKEVLCRTCYRRLLEDRKLDGLVTCPPQTSANSFHVYNQFTIRSCHRDELKEFLSQVGVPSEIYYSLCLHLQPAFSHLGHSAGDFPVAESASKQVLSLPVFPELTDGQQDVVVKAIINSGDL